MPCSIHPHGGPSRTLCSSLRVGGCGAQPREENWRFRRRFEPFFKQFRTFRTPIRKLSTRRVEWEGQARSACYTTAPKKKRLITRAPTLNTPRTRSLVTSQSVPAGARAASIAVTQCPNEPPPRKRQWRGKAAARGRRLEGKRIEDCARASSSRASSSRASTAAPPCAAVAGGGDVEGGVGVRQDLEQEELVVPPVAGAQGVGREHKLTPSEPSTALSLGRHHARRVSWPTRNGMQHRRACCRSMARHGSRLACHGCARSRAH